MKYFNKFIFGCVIAFMLSFLQIQEVRAAKFMLDPSSQSLVNDCQSSINILIDTEGSDSIAADAIISYNPAQLEIIDQNPYRDGIQIREGNIFAAYAGNIVDPAKGKIYLTAFNMMGTYNSRGVPGYYGAIVFKGRTGVSTAQLTFDAVLGDTTDSNIIDLDSVDTLTSVQDASFSFISTYCGTDSEPPFIQGLTPVPGSRENSLNANIEFTVVDDLAGVDISSVTVRIDNEVYGMGDSSVSYTGDPKYYAIVVDPVNDFLADVLVHVAIDARDLHNNLMPTLDFTFNRPITDFIPPYVRNVSPSPGSQGVAPAANIHFNIKDDISGVDLVSIQVSIDNVTYKNGDSSFFVSGSQSDYFVTIDPIVDFAEDTPVSISIAASDLDGNVMSTYSFAFNQPTVDNKPPSVIPIEPVPDSLDNPLGANIVFRLTDNLSGVDIKQMIVEVNEQVFTADSSEVNITGSVRDYLVTIDPVADFLKKELIVVSINVADSVGNVMKTYSYSFNKPPVCGNGIVEPGEECEPPLVGCCDSECMVIGLQQPGEEEFFSGPDMDEEGELRGAARSEEDTVPPELPEMKITLIGSDEAITATNKKINNLHFLTEGSDDLMSIYISGDIVSDEMTFQEIYIDFVLESEFIPITLSGEFGSKTIVVFGKDEYGNVTSKTLKVEYVSSEEEMLDSDSDGLSDAEENVLGTKPYDDDTDNDCIMDGEELLLGTDPLNPDSDGDGLTDGCRERDDLHTDPLKMDTDGDSFNDGVEVQEGTDPLDPKSFPEETCESRYKDKGYNGMDDPDSDGVSNSIECSFGSDPFVFDTDNDGYGDGDEILNYHSNPLDPADPNFDVPFIKITNLKSGLVTSNRKPSIQGIIYGSSRIIVFAKDKSGKTFELGRTAPDEKGVFMLIPQSDLGDGIYEIQAIGFGEDWKSEVVQSNVYRVMIRYGVLFPEFTVSSIDDYVFPGGLKNQGDVDDFLQDNQIILKGTQPEITGSALFGATVDAVFNSTISKNSVFLDDLDGAFTLRSSKVLEPGEHVLVIYATTAEGVRSAEMFIPFTIDPWARVFSILYTVILVISVASVGYGGIKVVKWIVRKAVVGSIKSNDVEK